MNRDQIVQRLLQPDYVATHFEGLAIDIYRYQYRHCKVYKDYVDSLGKPNDQKMGMSDIPFLPISAFKSHKVISSDVDTAACFESSGTTLTTTSKHYVTDLSLYRKMASLSFSQFYGDVSEYCVLGLLPSYLERKNSSLVYMVDDFIKASKDNDSGFYLDEYPSLISILRKKQRNKKPTILIGVSFALLDLAEQFKEDLSHIVFMETGGMKGKRKEIPRASLHQIIQDSFNVSEVHSEYGMTELLSQSYSMGNGIFKEGYSMRCITRQVTDPLSEERMGKTGVLNIIDLANVDSCSFVETQDLVKMHSDRAFEILGRIDQSDLRGCNLLLET